MNDRQRRARAALFSLKETVLEVLYEARNEGFIEAQTIRKRLCIPNVDNPTHMTNSLLFGILDHLKREGNVDHLTNVGWKITQEAVSLFDAAQIEE